MALGRIAVGDLLRVVGGATSGGIIVREGMDKSSAEAAERLSNGALIWATHVEDDRVRYERASGAGPAAGWISMSAAGRALVVKEENRPVAEVEEPAEAVAVAWYSQRLVEARKAGKGDFILDREVSPVERMPVKTQGGGDGGDGTAGAEISWEAGRNKTAAERPAASGLLAHLLGPRAKDVVEDVDGELIMLCNQCSLPLGECGYTMGETDASPMHADCLAQAMMRDRQKDEERRIQREVAVKKARRAEYDIGWKPSTIPPNADAAGKLGCTVVPQGLCCLVMEADDEVRVAPTFEPAAALNLEYLSIALQVRRTENREPLFSLDPIAEVAALASPEGAMQKKRFEPEWLAGTSVGEIMFQADYHLKELSMGEYTQPVVGMKSCLDLEDITKGKASWSGREWFVVRQAELHISEDAVIVPYLKMGVEARSQVVGPMGDYEDAALTRPDHPLVKYAEAFTHNFDLIAERKSVVSQLREVAKASIVAKFMVESGVRLAEQWFGLGSVGEGACCLEVPQLWNIRMFSNVLLGAGNGKDAIVRDKAGPDKMHGLYGGVDFGIDRFRLAAPTRLAASVVAGRAALGRPASTLMATSQAGLAMAPGQRFTRLAAPLSARAALTAPSRLAPPMSARAGLAAPISAMRPATALMATSRASMAAPQARLAAPLRASLISPPTRMAAPLTARASLAAPLSAMAGARPATSLMATSRLGVAGAAGRLAAPLSAMTAARPASSLTAVSRVSMAAPQAATARLSLGMPRGVDLSLDKFNLSAIVQGSWAGSVEGPPGSEAFAVDGEAFWSGLDGGKHFAAEDAELFARVFNPIMSDRRADGDKFVPPQTALSYMHRLKNLVKEEAELMEQRKAAFFDENFDEENMGPLFPAYWTPTIGLQRGDGVARPAERLLTARPDLMAEEGMLQDVLASATPSFKRVAEDGTEFKIFKIGSLEVRTTRAPAGELKVGAVFSFGAAVATKNVELKPADNHLKVYKVVAYVERAKTGGFHYFVALHFDKDRCAIAEQVESGDQVWSEGSAAARGSSAKILRTLDIAASPVALGRLRESAPDARRLGASASKRFARALCLAAAGPA